MPIKRSLALKAAAALKSGASQLTETNILVGFDGFVDTILHVVKTRHSATKYVRMDRMSAFGEAITDAAGLSANMEMVSQMQNSGAMAPSWPTPSGPTEPR